MKKALFLFIFGVFLISFTSALTYEQSQNITLTIPFSEINYTSGNTYNITIIKPDSTILIDNDLAIVNLSYLSYALTDSQTTDNGEYLVYIVGNESGYDKTSYLITTNGKALPSGIVIALFTLIIIFIVVELLGLLIWTILHFIEINIDAKDLILNVSSYLGLWIVYILAIEYLGNSFINSFLLTLIEIGAVTTMIIPLSGFVISYIKQNMKTGDHN
jgi:hypothetical protein|tara:strand:+ start:9385 stop:10035 length:651 start_codon:yes stop_codon:yes gene_type:complete